MTILGISEFTFSALAFRQSSERRNEEVSKTLLASACIVVILSTIQQAASTI